MTNLIQESLQLQNPPQDLHHPNTNPFDSRFSMLCLNTSAAVDHHPPPCSSCGRREVRSASTTTSFPMKRRSPTPSYSLELPTGSSSFLEPKPKRLFLDQEDASASASAAGFSKIDLPIPFGSSSVIPAGQVVQGRQPNSLLPLRRTVSDPTEAYFYDSCPPVNSDQSPEKTKCSLPPVTPSSRPPVPTPSPLPLRRTASDPNPSPENLSGSPNKVGKISDLIKEESPDSKRLKRMKDRMKEMNQWLNEVMREQEQEEPEQKQDQNDTKENDSEEEREETVGVEKVGDSLKLHLKCSCGKGFEILLSGRSCFYKLM